MRTSFFVAGLAGVSLTISLSYAVDYSGVKIARIPERLMVQTVKISDTRITKADLRLTVEIENKSTFLKQGAGGSFLVGLLFGPIGGAANRSNIERTTNEVSKTVAGTGLFQFDAVEIAREAYSDSPLTDRNKDAQSQLLINPYVIYYVFDEAVGVEYVVGMTVVGAGENPVLPFDAKYSYIFDGSFPMSSMNTPLSDEQLAVQRKRLKAGFADLFKALQLDLDGKAPAKQDIAKLRARGLQVSGGISVGKEALAVGNVARNDDGAYVLRAACGKDGKGLCEILFESDKLYTIADGPIERVTK